MLDFVIKFKTFFLFVLLLLLVYFPLFLHLDYMPFRMWDESILGVNAIAMADNHNYIVTYIFGKPDVFNCKPPLMIWCIVLFSRLLGFSELSLRLPSALAALTLCIYLFFILRKYSGSVIFGFLVVVVLITCQGYVRVHVTRTGEYDSMLVLFTTLFSMNLFFATEATERKEQSKYLFLFFLFLALAVLTKGIACMMLVPGLFIYVVMRKKIIVFLKDKAFYWGMLIFIGFGIGYYFLRESINPGYLKAVWNNEIGGRFGSANEGHTGSATYYLNELVTWQFIEYMLLFPLALIVGLQFSDSKIKRIVLFSVIVAGLFLIVVSSAQTKLAHYDAPVFPFFAVIVASLFHFIYSRIKKGLTKNISVISATVISFICILLFFAKPYKDIIGQVYFQKGSPWDEDFSVSCKIFQYAARGKIDVTQYKLVFDEFDENQGFGWGTVLRCYIKELQEHGMATQIVNHDEIRVNDKAVIFDNDTRQKLEQKFEMENLGHIAACNADMVYLKKER